MPYNYTSYVASLTSLLVAPDTQGQANLMVMLPNIIDYAELRMYRDLDLLTTLVPLVTTSIPFNRNLAVPSTAIVVQSANMITPANTIPDNGTRNPMTRTTIEFINAAYPQSTTLGISPSVSQYYALQNNNTFSVGGSNYTAIFSSPPDNTYLVEFMSTVRPTPLSAANANTVLTQFFPDMFLAASMIFAAGYQRDFSAQSDDPKLAQSWENQYQLLKSSAETEELRKKAMSSDWTTFSPSQVAPRP